MKHWKKHRPNMAADLERRGLLEKAALMAQERSREAILDLMQEGADLEQAKELVLTKLIYLPDEEEEPTLSPDQMPFSQPSASTTPFEQLPT